LRGALLHTLLLLLALQLEALVASTRELKERQERPDPPEALASVPALKLSDIPREVPKVRGREGREGVGTRSARLDGHAVGEGGKCERERCRAKLLLLLLQLCWHQAD
jgi:hypothetical protein